MGSQSSPSAEIAGRRASSGSFNIGTMSNHQQRRSTRLARPQPPSYADPQQYGQPTPPPKTPPPGATYTQQAPLSPRSQPYITFQDTELGDRQNTLEAQRRKSVPSAYHNQLPPTPQDPESGDYGNADRVGRKKSLVRPDREKIEPGHRQWYYRTHAARLGDEGTSGVDVQPSSASFCNKKQFLSSLTPFFPIQLLGTTLRGKEFGEASPFSHENRTCKNRALRSSNAEPLCGGDGRRQPNLPRHLMLQRMLLVAV